MEDEKEQESGLSIQVFLEDLAEGMKTGEWNLVQSNLDQIVQLIQKARVGKPGHAAICSRSYVPLAFVLDLLPGIIKKN